MTEGAAGCDLVAAENVLILSNETHLVKTGTAVKIPEGYVGLLLPRSSICNKQGLSMPNSVGIIDSDFTGEMRVPFRNSSQSAVMLHKYERIAQLVVVPCVVPNYVKVQELETTDRGAGGFGSTNKQPLGMHDVH